VDDAFKNASAMGDITLFYYNINKKDDTKDAYATALGGSLKYTTDSSKSVFASATFHNSTPIFKHENKNLTKLFNNDNNADALTVLSESFLAYKTEDTILKAGNFFLNTPLINKSSSRIIPWSYQGATFVVNDIYKSSFQLSYINKMRNNTTDSYTNESLDGEFNNITIFGFKHHPIEQLDVHLYYYYVPSLYDSSFFQVDYKNHLKNSDMLFCLGFQHYKTFDDSDLYKDVDLLGFRTGIFTDNLDITLNYTNNRGDSKASGYGGLSKIYTISMISNGRGADKAKTWMLKTNLEFEMISKHSSEFSIWLANIKSDTSEHNSYYTHFRHNTNNFTKIYLRYEYEDYKQNNAKDAHYLRFITSYEF